MRRNAFTYNINQSGRAIRGYMERRMIELVGDELTLAEATILEHIASFRGGTHITSGDLMCTFGVSKATMSQVLATLIDMELLEMKKVSLDHRIKRIVLTNKGKTAAIKYHRCFEQIKEQMERGLTVEEIDQAEATIGKVLANIGVNQ